jgi:hypothetical protein
MVFLVFAMWNCLQGGSTLKGNKKDVTKSILVNFKFSSVTHSNLCVQMMGLLSAITLSIKKM